MFNLQMFGDNDTVTSSSNVKLVYWFEDGDTRATTLPNPKATLTSAEVESCSSVLRATQAFVGDKNNAPFYTIYKASIVDSTRIDLDIS